MSEYDTPNWTHRVMLAIILGGLLSLVVAVAHAKDFTMECFPFKGNDRVQCEMKGLTEWRVHWLTTINGEKAQHEIGSVVYLTLTERWRGLQVYVLTRNGKQVVWEGLIRWDGTNAVFGRTP